MVFTAYEGGQTRETRVARLRRKEEMKVTAKREKIGVQRHIRIADSEMNAQIERLMEQPGYESANKVINDALYYGLPILAEKVCGDAVTQEERAALKAPRKEREQRGRVLRARRPSAAGNGSERDHQQVHSFLAV